jgi:hypothetical protein
VCDIAIRGIAEGKGPYTKAREVMSQEVKYSFEDEAVEHVAENMAELQVRRLPVLNRDKRLVGIVSLGDLATQGSLPKTARGGPRVRIHLPPAASRVRTWVFGRASHRLARSLRRAFCFSPNEPLYLYHHPPADAQRSRLTLV